MADNVTLPAQGTGTTTPVIATDEVGGVQYQEVKLDGGGDGLSVPIIAGQQAMAGSLPVVVASNQTAVPISAASLPLPTGAATAANQPGLGTAGTPSANVLTVQGIASMTPLSVNPISGQTGVQGGSGTVSNTTQRVVLATDVALPTGSNAIGKLASNTGVTIGAVEIAAAQTLATVTTVSTVTALGAGTTGPMKAEDAGHSTGDQGFPAWGVRVDTPNTALSNTDLDYSVIATSSTGALRWAPLSEDFAALANGPQVKKYYTNAGAVTDGIVWSPAAGKRWYVTDLYFQVSAACTVTFEDDLSGGDSPVLKGEFAANSGGVVPYQTPLFSGEDAADLLVTTTAGNIYITITGYEI